MTSPLSPLQARRILGLPTSADVASVKRAYRRLARKHHPDVGGDPATFQRLRAAYEVLRTQPAPADVVSRGTPSRPARTRAATDPDRYAWDVAAPLVGSRLDADGLATLLATAPAVRLLAASRAPRARTNHLAAHLSADFGARMSVRSCDDEHGSRAVAIELRTRARRARRATVAVDLPSGWTRRRAGSTVALNAAVAGEGAASGEPDEPLGRLRAAHAVDVLSALLERLDWPLAEWRVIELSVR